VAQELWLLMSFFAVAVFIGGVTHWPWIYYFVAASSFSISFHNPSASAVSIE
jgi:polyferredoxin